MAVMSLVPSVVRDCVIKIIFTTRFTHTKSMGSLHKTTAEMTERELELAYDAYIRSKCVNGRYCPTPELHTKDEMSDDETSSESISPCSSNAVHAIPRDANREWAEKKIACAETRASSSNNM